MNNGNNINKQNKKVAIIDQKWGNWLCKDCNCAYPIY